MDYKWKLKKKKFYTITKNKIVKNNNSNNLAGKTKNSRREH